jgi:hypothetical protein
MPDFAVHRLSMWTHRITRGRSLFVGFVLTTKCCRSFRSRSISLPIINSSFDLLPFRFSKTSTRTTPAIPQTFNLYLTAAHESCLSLLGPPIPRGSATCPLHMHNLRVHSHTDNPEMEEIDILIMQRQPSSFTKTTNSSSSHSTASTLKHGTMDAV